MVKWWKIGVVASAIAIIAPFLFVYLTCLVTAGGGGCGDFILLFIPVYFIAVPAFVVSYIGLLISVLIRRRK